MTQAKTPAKHASRARLSALLPWSLALLLVACGGGGTPNPVLTLSPSSAAVGVGQSVVLTAFLDGSATAAVTWSSSDSGVASVNAGVVTGEGVGTATVTAALSANPAVQATATVTVTDPDGEPDGAPTAVAAGMMHSLALTAGGEVWAWGSNASGQLGVGATVMASEQRLRVPLSGSYVDVAAGDHFSLALRSDGTVWAWGDNQAGQVGENGEEGLQRTPVQVDGVAGATAIAASTSTAFALLDDGTVVAWGANYSGALGRGDFMPVSDPAPAPVVGLTRVTQLAAGGTISTIHALALREDGSVWAWGSNALAALGVEPLGTSARATAAAVPGLPADIVQVAAGQSFSLALLDDGTIRSWGAGNVGQLGDDQGSAFSVAPVTVLDLDDVVAVAAGQQFALALHAGGTLSAWGADGFGQLGIGVGSGFRLAPQPVAAVQDVLALAGGVQHALAVDDSGRIWGWGSNLGLRLGLPEATEQQVFPVVIWE